MNKRNSTYIHHTPHHTDNSNVWLRRGQLFLIFFFYSFSIIHLCILAYTYICPIHAKSIGPTCHAHASDQNNHEIYDILSSFLRSLTPATLRQENTLALARPSNATRAIYAWSRTVNSCSYQSTSFFNVYHQLARAQPCSYVLMFEAVLRWR